MINPEMISRDERGNWCHSSFRHFFMNEIVDFPGFLTLLKEHNLDLEAQHVNFEDLYDNCSSDNALAHGIKYWDPQTPDGAGWFVAAVYETEDGGLCFHVRHNGGAA